MKDYSIYKLNEDLAYVLIKKYNALSKDINIIEKNVSSKYSSVIIDNLLTVGKYSNSRFFLIKVNKGKFDYDSSFYSENISSLLKLINTKYDTEIIIKKVNRSLDKNKDIIKNSDLLRFQQSS